MVINQELYAQATKELRATGRVLPSPLDSPFARIACNPTFTPALRQYLADLRFRVEPKSLGGASCYDPGPLNFHFPPAPIQMTTTPPAPVKPPSAPAPVRPSTPLRVPTPSHETPYQRQLQDAWEEGYDTVMKSPSHTHTRAHTPSPSRTVHMRSPTPPTPTRVILPMPCRRISPP